MGWQLGIKDTTGRHRATVVVRADHHTGARERQRSQQQPELGPTYRAYFGACPSPDKYQKKKKRTITSPISLGLNCYPTTGETRTPTHLQRGGKLLCHVLARHKM